jgi:thiamine pyrophosphate-dependent acetolactate synthase large subunit-like protein/nitrite reductase/ring-hydroxylating ferredoxin subunit
MSKSTAQPIIWHRVADLDELPEGRVKAVSIGAGAKEKSVCLTHHDGKYGALDNHCPHQGGPLGEGTIENGWLRCPWHGWDYCPHTGRSPGGYDDGVATYPVEVRKDGIYVGLEREPEHVRSVTDVMAETMTAWGITHVFGMVGHSNLGLADAIRRQCDAGRLRYIGIRHEGAGAFAASAFGKLTGDPAACLTIAGPGATNLLTGLWDAKVDRSPVLALTGQVQQQVFGPGAFQELPLKEAFSAVSEFSHTVLPDSRHAELMSLAVKAAVLKQDVAHLIFPDDVQTIPAREDAAAGSPKGRIAPARIAPAEEAVAAATELLRGSRRPVLVVGHGARFDMDEVLPLAEMLNAPVVTTFKAKGIIGDRHPLAGGVLGRSGTPVASWLMNESDALVVLGASFSNHTGITPKKPTIQGDRDRTQIAKFHAIDVPVWGDLGVTCGLLVERLAGHETDDQRPDVASRWKIWRQEKRRRLGDDRGKGVSSIAVFEAMNRHVPGNAIIAVDVGNNTYSFGRYFESSGDQSVLMSGYLGSIGFGYPAAIGAWAATQVPDRWGGRFYQRPVVAVTGDGGFGQYPWEVTTAVKYGMNITHVLLHNDELGKISKEQRAGGWDVWETSLVNPDIAAFVTSCGGLGIRVESVDQLDAALERAFAFDGPATVEVMADAELV